MRILCVGSNLESEIAIKGLVEHGAHVVGLITRPPELSGNVSDYVDLNDFCIDKSIELINTTDINSPETLKQVLRIRPDYVFVLGWSQLLNDDFLKIPTGFAIGSHPSPLPKGRGRAPVPWTILEGATETAVSLFKIDTGVDSGEIVWQKFFPVAPDEYAMSLYLKVAANLKLGFCEVHDALLNSTLTFTHQDESEATYRKKRTPDDGIIDFTQPALHVSRLIRAVSEPYPGAFTYMNDRRIEIWRTRAYKGKQTVGLPGQILKREGESLLVQTVDSALWLSCFTCEGKAVNAHEFNIEQIFHAPKGLNKLDNPSKNKAKTSGQSTRGLS